MKNKMYKLLLLLFFSLSLNLTNKVLGQELIDTVPGYTLDELKKYALEHNYEVKNADLEIKKAKMMKWENTAIGLPQVNAEANFQTFPLIPTSLLPGEIFGAPGKIPVQFGNEHNADWGITVSQLVFSGEYLVGLKALKVYQQLSEKSKIKSEITVKENVEKTYYLILVSEEIISVLDSLMLSTQNLVSENEKLFEAGFVEETDIEQLRLNLKNTESSLISFNKQKEILYRLIKFQIGMDFSNKLKISDSLDHILSEIEENNLFMEEFRLHQNVDYQLMQVNESLADLDYQREKATVLPTLSAFYSYKEQAMRDSLNFFSSDEEWFPTSVWGLSLSIPIFSSGQRYAKIKQKQFDRDQKINLKLQTEQALMLEVEQTKSDFLISINNVRNNSEQRHLAKKIYNNSLKKYKVGTEQSFMLTQYQTQYFMSLNNYYQALNELIDKHITLKRLMNQL